MNKVKQPFLVILLSCFASPLCGQEEVFLSLGEEVALELEESAKSIDFTDADIVAVDKGRTKRKLFVRAKQVGSTKGEITLSSGKVLVYVFRVEKSVEHLLPIFSRLSGVTASMQNGKIVVQGKVTRKHVADELDRLKGRYSGKIIDSTIRELLPKNRVVARINSTLEENGIMNVKARSYGNIIALEGSPADENQEKIAVRLARGILPDIDVMLSKTSNGGPALNIEVLFVEVSKWDELNFGFSQKGVDSSGPSGTIGNIGIDAIVGKAGGLNWQIGPLSNFLNMIRKDSAARVLSNPRLITRSGSEARFHSGKRIYFGVRDDADEDEKEKEDKIKIAYIETGIILRIIPFIDPLGQIDSRIYSEISDVGEAQANAMHTVVRSEVETSVTLLDGQTILLSGLTSQRNNKEVEKIPLLGDIPIIGELFKTRRKRDENREVIALVTMRQMQEAMDGVESGLKLWQQSEADVSLKIMD